MLSPLKLETILWLSIKRLCKNLFQTIKVFERNWWILAASQFAAWRHTAPLTFFFENIITILSVDGNYQVWLCLFMGETAVEVELVSI